MSYRLGQNAIVVTVVTGALLQGNCARTSRIPSPASTLPAEVVKQNSDNREPPWCYSPVVLFSGSPRVPELAKTLSTW